MNINEKYMEYALKEAEKAYAKDEVPIGAVIVYNNKIIAKGHNLRESKKNSILHAEMIVINKACKKLEAWRLCDCELYVTCEPCPMCAGAIMQSRIKKVIYGCKDPKMGALGSSFNLFEQKGINHIPEIEEGSLEEKCSSILKKFFKEKRIK